MKDLDPQFSDFHAAEHEAKRGCGTRKRMQELENSGLASIRAYWLVASFAHFCGYVSPAWAGKFLDAWCQRPHKINYPPSRISGIPC